VNLVHHRAVEITEEAGEAGEEAGDGDAAEELGTVAKRASERGKTRTKLPEGTTIGKGDMTRRWPEPVHLDAYIMGRESFLVYDLRDRPFGPYTLKAQKNR
jgi:hypothetical protein